MEYENYWGIGENFQDEVKYTDNIHKIIEKQCEYLSQYTQGKVFAVFDEIKIANAMLSTSQFEENLNKIVANITSVKGNNNEKIPTTDLVDINEIYSEKHYEFQICTDKYRFRLFELVMTPIYPVKIIVDEGICKNIGSKLSKIAETIEESNYYEICDEDAFCEVLKNVLQDRKVRYIIKELQKRVEASKTETECITQKVIICEGQNDEVILQAIARKLDCNARIVSAGEKRNVPIFFNTLYEKDKKSDILMVVDSDGDEEQTKKMIEEKVNAKTGSYGVAIINNQIEDWFASNVKGFSKLKLMQSIEMIIEEADFKQIRNSSDAFAKVVDFLQK